MIVSIKSFSELMLTSKSRAKSKSKCGNPDLHESKRNNLHSTEYVKAKDTKLIKLPNLPKFKRRKWIKGKEALSRFIDELDYNNQIQSSYDLTLLERQRNHDQNNVA